MARLLLIPLVLIGLLLAGIKWSTGNSGRRADLAFINRGDNKTLDPSAMSWMQDIRIAYALWEGLYTLDPQTLKPIMGAAESVDISPDQLVYTFHLRHDARWSNGDPVTAGDFLFEWRRMLESPGEYTYLHHYIQGAQAYQECYDEYIKARQARGSATPPDFSKVGEEALDSQTFRVTLTNPVPFFPSLCAFPSFFPLHELSMHSFKYTDGVTGQVSYYQEFTRPPNLVSNGPYRLDDWSFKRRLRLVANDFYWDRANVKSRVIDQIYADDALAGFRLYEQGQVDWLADVDPEIAAPLLQKHERSDLHVFPAFGTYFYDFNCQPKLSNGGLNPLADARVRQALTMAVDKTPIVRDVGRLGQPISNVYVPPHVFSNYESPPGISYNLDRARQLLADAGYPNGRNFPRLSILFNNESFHADIAVIVQRQWSQNLGIDVDLEGVEVKIFGDRKHKHDFTIARGGWYGDYYDPSTFTDKYLTAGDNNDGQWSNPRYDALCANATTEPNPQKRYQLFAQAENILLEDAGILPMYTYVGAYLFPNRVQGIPLSPQQMLMFKAVRKAD